jgi:hypothetical protein
MRISASGVIFLGLALCLAAPAAAKPTEAQLDAIKSNCRSDFMSNCWGVKRGGIEAMQCLKQHMSSLSPGCQTAVKAVQPPAPKPAEAPKPAAAPEPVAAPEPAAPPKSATSPEAPKEPEAETKAAEPAPAAEAAVEQEASEIPESKEAATPAPPKEAAPQAAETAPSPAAQSPNAAPAASDAPAAGTAAPDPAAAAPEAMPPIVGFIPPRKKLMVNRGCKDELNTYCAGVDFGEGRLLRCLWSNKPSLSAQCQAALDKLTQ